MQRPDLLNEGFRPVMVSHLQSDKSFEKLVGRILRLRSAGLLDFGQSFTKILQIIQG